MTSNAKKLYMIGNSHIDPVWLWQWQEGYQEIKATFRSVLDRMKEYPDFVFTGSSAAFYEFVEQNDPAMFEEIKQRVAEGRWEIVGGWWIQPDCNLPSGESFVRQGLVGQHYFKNKLGVTAKVGYNPDSFGHHGMLPQILQKSGMPYYLFMRPGPHEMGLPGRLFWWESDDGTRVLTFRIPFEYLTWGGDVEKHVARVAEEGKAPFDELICFYGVGNHGGGPTKENINSIHRLNDDPNFPELLMASSTKYFEEMLTRDLPIPVVHDDLQHHASGCYAVHSGIKQWNRRAENTLLTAEKFSAVAKLLSGQPYPDFSQAWKNVLFNQFHDILAGTSLEPAYDDARDMHGEAMAVGARALNHATQALSWRIKIDHEEGVRPVVVFNPHTWPVKAIVELETGGLSDNHVLLDDEGHQVPFQFVRSYATVTGWRKRPSFVAELPALGWRVYRFMPNQEKRQFERLSAGTNSIESARFRLTVDPDSGFISSLFDKKTNHEVFSGPAARPTVIEDLSDTWSHGVLAYDKKIGTFRAKSVRVVEEGPVKVVLRVESTYGNSTMTQDFTLYKDLDQVDVACTVDWHEQHKVLKLRFPTNLHFPRAVYEIPYGHIERPTNGEEEPGQNWIDLSGVVRGIGRPYGIAILNDSKYSFSIKESEMSLTVLRSPIYAHHDPYVPTPEGRYTYMDQGMQRFTYSILPHEGNWERAGVVKRAAELNQKPVALPETYHDGPLPQKGSFLTVDRENVMVSVLKQAEDGEDLILRAYETDKVAVRATITLAHLNRTIEADFGPCEIKTFRIPADASAPVVETNLLEWTE